MRGIRHGLGMAIAMLATSVGGAQAPGSVLRDCADCPEVVVVPPGRFLMGASAGDEEREGVPEPYRARSQPVTAMTIARPFAIGRFPVTRAEFGAFVAATARRMEAGCGGSWYALPWSVRSGYRGSNTPGDRDTNIGLRVARDLAP